LVSFYDLRKSGAPQECSVIEKSHHDPVYDCFWISSKTGNQCASVSTDGNMLWWDTRRLGEPVDALQLSTGKDGAVLGGSAMDYHKEVPTKYVVGTEQGIVLAINLRNRKQNNGIAVYDQNHGKHHGPIYAIHRNQTHTKFFMTVGDCVEIKVQAPFNLRFVGVWGRCYSLCVEECISPRSYPSLGLSEGRGAEIA